LRPSQRLWWLTAAAILSACASDSDARTSGAPLVFACQEGWIEEQPSSDMRAVQYRLTGAGIDSGDASLVVYHFGGAGGSAEANLERWVSQFEQPDGSPSADRMERQEGVLNGRAILEVELSGIFVAETFPGSGERVHRPNTRMLAAILQSDHGPYYIKMVGPASAVIRWEPSYRAFLEAIR